MDSRRYVAHGAGVEESCKGPKLMFRAEAVGADKVDYTWCALFPGRSPVLHGSVGSVFCSRMVDLTAHRLDFAPQTAKRSLSQRELMHSGNECELHER